MTRKRGKDSWEVRVYLGRDPQTGKKMWKYTTVRGSERDAEQVERHCSAGRHPQPKYKPLDLRALAERYKSEFPKMNSMLRDSRAIALKE